MHSVLSADEEIVRSSKRKKKRFCDHCNRLVSIRTFNDHKRRKTVDHANDNDELHNQDLHSDSNDLDLDFDFSSDECSEVVEFAAESPELQDTFVSGSDDTDAFSNAESSDSLNGETDDEAELLFENLLSSSDEEDVFIGTKFTHMQGFILVCQFRYACHHLKSNHWQLLSQ